MKFCDENLTDPQNKKTVTIQRDSSTIPLATESAMMSRLTLDDTQQAIPSAPPAYEPDTTVKITFIPFNGDEKQLTLAESLEEYKELIKEKRVSYLHELIEKNFAIKRANQRLSIQIADPGKPKELWKKRVQWSSDQFWIHSKKIQLLF